MLKLKANEVVSLCQPPASAGLFPELSDVASSELLELAGWLGLAFPKSCGWKEKESP